MSDNPETLDLASLIAPMSLQAPAPESVCSCCTTITNSSSGIPEDVVPWPGETFLIREQESEKTITVCNGALKLCRGFNQHGGFLWECVENNGWLGFRNCVSGKYMGHDNAGKFVADAGEHKQNEWFCARRYPDGGYLLLVRRGDDLLKMAISDDGQGIVETGLEGTRWEFNTAYMEITTERIDANQPQVTTSRLRSSTI